MKAISMTFDRRSSAKTLNESMTFSGRSGERWERWLYFATAYPLVFLYVMLRRFLPHVCRMPAAQGPARDSLLGTSLNSGPPLPTAQNHDESVFRETSQEVQGILDIVFRI